MHHKSSRDLESKYASSITDAESVACKHPLERLRGGTVRILIFVKFPCIFLSQKRDARSRRTFPRNRSFLFVGERRGFHMRHNDQSWTRDNATGNSYTDVLHGTLKLGACHSRVVTGNFLEKAARCQSRKQFVSLWSDGWKNSDVKEDGTSRRGLYLLVIHEGPKMWNRRSSFYRIVFESNLFPDISITHTVSWYIL